MSLETFTDWVLALPKADQDMPYMDIEGTMYSPRQLLKEAQKDTPIGKKALQLFAAGKFVGSPAGVSRRELAIERIKLRYGQLDPEKPVFFVLRTGDTQVMPKEIIDAVEAKTDFGEEIIRMEEEYLDYLKQLKRR